MRFLREPLLHFFALGVAIFAFSALVADPATDAPARIVVTAGQIEHLATGFARTWQRPPTASELDGLVDDFVREEIAYREATALGLDRDDTIVRRRMRQKLEFVTDDAAAVGPPSDAELEAWLRAHPDAFRSEPRLSFRQIYLSRDRRGDAVDDDARRLLARLAGAGADADVAGDSLMVPDTLELAPRREVAHLFGDAFAARLVQVEPSRWAGPVESGYGVHLVFVSRRVEARLPDLAEVRDAVEREWLTARRKEVVEAAYRVMRERYTVVVERPPGAVAAR